MTTPRITWDLGTAYDLFISLHVLHEPVDFGLRGYGPLGCARACHPPTGISLSRCRAR